MATMFTGNFVLFCLLKTRKGTKWHSRGKNTPMWLDTPVKKEDQREPPVGQQSQGSSPRQPDVKLTSKHHWSHHPWASHLMNRHLGSKNHLNSHPWDNRPRNRYLINKNPLNRHPWDNHPKNSRLREKTKNKKYHENKGSTVVVKNNSLKLERIKRQMKITLGIFFFTWCWRGIPVGCYNGEFHILMPRHKVFKQRLRLNAFRILSSVPWV